jgi:hypothetical protein
MTTVALTLTDALHQLRRRFVERHPCDRGKEERRTSAGAARRLITRVLSTTTR